MTKELCAFCDEPTGRAGVHDDSLFISSPLEDYGPYCEECYDAALEEVCGLCGDGGADKVPQPHYWPGEQRPDTEIVHQLCEQEASKEAHAALTQDQRNSVLGRLRR